MADRQNAQKREQDNDPNHCYQFKPEQNLEPKDYSKQQCSCREYAESFVLRSEIEQQGDKVVIKGLQKLKHGTTVQAETVSSDLRM